LIFELILRWDWGFLEDLAEVASRRYRKNLPAVRHFPWKRERRFFVNWQNFDTDLRHVDGESFSRGGNSDNVDGSSEFETALSVLVGNNCSVALFDSCPFGIRSLRIY
jgi:hypothetical protein